MNVKGFNVRLKEENKTNRQRTQRIFPGQVLVLFLFPIMASLNAGSYTAPERSEGSYTASERFAG